MPYWRLYYHLVWATADRKPTITPNIEEEVYEAIKKKVKALGGEVFEINGTDDHIHVAVMCPPSISIAKLVGELKGASAFYINHLSGSPRPVDWHRGYGVVSFRKDNLDEIIEYIRRQKEHHSLGHVWEGLEDCEGDWTGQPPSTELYMYDPYA